VVGDDVKHSVPEEPESSILRLAQTRRRLDDLVQHRLQPLRLNDSPKHPANCALLLTQSVCARNLLDVGDLTRAHVEEL
jgi:hypothetical protein